jgi:hypothetical protein
MPKLENEAHVKREVKKILDKYGHFWFMPPANGYGRSGIADIISVHRAIFFAIETKFGKNKPTPMQIGFLASVRAEGGYAFVVNEERLEWLEAFLGAFERAVDASTRKEMPTPEDGAMMVNAIRELTTELPPMV